MSHHGAISPSQRAAPTPIALRRRRSDEHDEYYHSSRPHPHHRRYSDMASRRGSSYTPPADSFATGRNTAADGYVGGYMSPPVVQRQRALSMYSEVNHGLVHDRRASMIMGPGHFGSQLAAPGSLPTQRSAPITGMMQSPPILHPFASHGTVPEGQPMHFGGPALPGMMSYPNSMPLAGMSGGSPLPGASDYGRPKWAHFVKPDYRRACFKYGSADVPYASLPGGPLEGMPAQLSSQMYARW